MSDFDYEFRNKKENVLCSIEYCDKIEGKKGYIRPGVRVKCTKCSHFVESFGQSEKSIKRCLALLCEKCPNNEENWYEI